MEEINTGIVDIQSPAETFELLRGELGRIGIWRNGSYIGKHLPEEIDGDLIDWVRDTYGGGRYQVVLYGKDGKVKKRLSFSVAGEPKDPEKTTSPAKDGTIELIEKLVEKIEEKKTAPDPNTVTIFQMMMQMQQQQFQLILQTLKGERKENTLIEKLTDKILTNPAVLMSAGGALWKLLQKAITNKNEILELIKVAKDDPELKELAIQAVGAKYGTGSGILDKILTNPDLLTKTLEIINKALTAKAAGQNPIPQIKKQLKEISNQSQTNLSNLTTNPQPKNPQHVDTSNNQKEVITVQEIITTGTKILEMTENGNTPEQIWKTLTDTEIDTLTTLVHQYNIKTAQQLITFLKNLPIPQFMITGYINAIERHAETINTLLRWCIIEEIQEENQETPQEKSREEITGYNRKTAEASQADNQENHRENTGNTQE